MPVWIEDVCDCREASLLKDELAVGLVRSWEDARARRA